MFWGRVTQGGARSSLALGYYQVISPGFSLALGGGTRKKAGDFHPRLGSSISYAIINLVIRTHSEKPARGVSG